MKEYYDFENNYNQLRSKIVGLGEHSIRKSYYPELQKKLSELEYSESKNKAVLGAIPDILILLDKDGNIIDLSNGKTDFNMSGELIGKNICEIKPNWIYEFYRNHIKDFFRSHQVIEFEYKYKEGKETKYCEIRAVSCRENEILLILRDITEQKKFRQEILELNKVLKKSEYTLRTLFEGSSDTILILRKNIITDCNPAAIELLGYGSKERLIGKSIPQISLTYQPDGKSSQDEVDRITKVIEKSDKVKFEWWFQKYDGTVFPVEVMLTAILLDSKRVLHASCRDISDRKQMELKLEYLSYHDQLTGLYNRRFFEEELKRLDVPRNYPLTIVLADVNGLKLINDSFGHTVGDEIIKKAASVILRGCRADDIAARLGGDEFVILLPCSSSKEASTIIKRIKSISEKEKVGTIGISASFGWASKEDENETIYEIFKKAEDMMYKQKLIESPSMRGRTITAIIKTLNEKNKREEAHSHRVSALCGELGKAISLSDGEVEELKTVGLFHDIGKIAIEESILNKEGKLALDEWEEIKRHPEIGYRILSTVNEMAEMAEYVLSHHERWDGKGYPKGLSKDEIPLFARIIAIADAFDAMTSQRTYKKILSNQEAAEELIKYAGTQFDPELVKVFTDKIINSESVDILSKT